MVICIIVWRLAMDINGTDKARVHLYIPLLVFRSVNLQATALKRIGQVCETGQRWQKGKQTPLLKEPAKDWP